jgi:uncharacterized protein (TIGR02118 family)
MLTVVYVLYRLEGLSREEFTRHWVDTHAALGAKLPGVRSYRIMPVTSATDCLGPEADGFALLEFDTQEDFDTAVGSPEMAAAGADAATFARHFDVYTVEQHTVI